MKYDDFSTRMKLYEGIECNRHFIPMIPILARIDGRSFHNYTKGLEKPYSENLIKCMQYTTKELIKETNAIIGYTQSDEITLLWYTDDIKKEIWFNGRIQKMVSQLAAQATIHFYKKSLKQLPKNYHEKTPTFDARIWQVPNKIEAANVFIWREMDASRNSISMLAHYNFSNKELHGKSNNDKIKMLEEKDIYWGNYPSYIKRGSYFKRELELKEINNELVLRSIIKQKEYPILSKIKNIVEVIFDNKEPILKENCC